MELGVFAEASPCCPSPVVGQLVIMGYIVGGTFMYIWLLSMLFRWAQGRYRQRRNGPEPNRH